VSTVAQACESLFHQPAGLTCLQHCTARASKP